MKKVLFVCLGNICRSPSAEAIFKHLVEQAKLSQQVLVDSCGIITDHEGESADIRMQEHGRKRNYNLSSIARGIQKSDLDDFDYVVTMDDTNFANVIELSNEANINKIQKMTDYCTSHSESEVPDPYYGGPHGFELVLDILEDACAGLLEKVESEL